MRTEPEPGSFGSEADTSPFGPILIADDDRDHTDSLATLFQLAGHAVLTAYDGQRALELALAFRPHWLLLDIGMPELTGYEIAARVRALPWGSSARVLALSGYGRFGDLKRSFEAGFDRHFIKPVEFGELIAFMKGEKLARMTAR